MNWILPTLLFASAISTATGAEKSGHSRERPGLGNSAASGFGRNASNALPLDGPHKQRYQKLDKLDWEYRPHINPFVRRRT
jgi:hypothetical protein